MNGSTRSGILQRPERLKHPPRQRRNVLRSQWTSAGGFRIHYRHAPGGADGTALPVVLVHGLVVSGLYLIPTAERLAGEFPVYVPDLPGFGDSEKPPEVLRVTELADALHAFLQVQRIERAALLGNSLGCQIITDLAVRYPGRVDRLVLNGPTVDPAARSAARHAFRLLIDVQRESWRLAAIQVRDYAKTGMVRALKTFRYMLEDRIEEKLPRIRVPTLIVRGSRDPIVPQRWAEEATRLLPDGSLKVIPGAAHATNYDAPLELVRVTRPFLQETTAQAHEQGDHHDDA